MTPIRQTMRGLETTNLSKTRLQLSMTPRQASAPQISRISHGPEAVPPLSNPGILFANQVVS